MFMFRSRRSNLIRKLWRLLSVSSDSLTQNDKKSLTTILNRVKEPQLESLVRAVETRGEEADQCCPVPGHGHGATSHGHHHCPLLLCHLARGWSKEQEMVRIPGVCDQDPLYTCCNPYHWSRVITQDCPPSPESVRGSSCLPGLSSSSTVSTSLLCSSSATISNSSQDSQSETAESTTEICSVATEDQRQYASSDVTWCKLAYWEERTRVGSQVSVSSSSVQVCSNTKSRNSSNSQALCLEPLFSLPEASKPSQATVRTRDKIGHGVILSQEDGGVWLHNRSNVPIFVNSPTLDVPNSRTFSVFKIPPSFSMEIFNWDLSRLYSSIRDPAAYDGPFDPHSVRLSLAKGWGANYARQYVECCPCWLEIMLLPSR